MPSVDGIRGRAARRERGGIAGLLAAALIAIPAAGALAVPPGFSNELVVPGITSATTIAFLPDGRMLVGELNETIWVVQPGASAPDPVPFLQIPVGELIDEQGLMDIVPDPDFASNQYFYVFYTRDLLGNDNRNRVSRFTASGNGTVPDSELVLWQDIDYANHEHHAGSLAFGTDGMLYITYGDQFFAETAQDLGSYRGKILRIAPDGTIPADNPFHDGAGPNKDEIWALGVRNPYRMSIDPVTGRMYFGDVGNQSWEEINVGVAGANYGWPLCEGPCAVPGFTNPIYWYSHEGRDAAVTGGFVYRGTQFPAEYHGSYFFADYAQNTIKRLTFDAGGNVTGVLNFEPVDGTPDGPYGDPVKLVQGPDGSLYYVDIGFHGDDDEGDPAAIRRIRYTLANQPPVAVASATPLSGAPPLEVSFSSEGSLDPEGLPLIYAWTFGDGGVSSDANPTHTYTAPGSYVARLSVSDGVSPTLSDDILISVGNPPTAEILTPLEGSLFRAGDAVGYAGSATDPEDGVLPASAYSWSILFEHDSHVHPAGGPFTNTTTGTLAIPTTGHSFQGDTHYRIVLTVTDADGLQATDSVRIDPEKVDLTFTTIPAGLQADVDGVRRTTPFVLDDVIGFSHVIGAPAQSSGGTDYAFQAWSDGGEASHTIVVPTGDASWQATFQAVSPPVAAYAFQEGSGTTTEDASGNENHGALVGASWTASGRFGNALLFDGSSALVQIPHSASLDLSSEMTLSAWVYPTSLGVERPVLCKEDLYYLDGSSSNGPPSVGGTFAAPLFGDTALPENAWSHLAATYDGATLRLFVDGVEVASRPQSGPIESSSAPLTLGGDPLTGQHWAGRIDEVRIYAVALEPEEIEAAMQTPIPEASAVQQLGAGLLALVGLVRARACRRSAAASAGADRVAAR